MFLQEKLNSKTVIVLKLNLDQVCSGLMEKTSCIIYFLVNQFLQEFTLLLKILWFIIKLCEQASQSYRSQTCFVLAFTKIKYFNCILNTYFKKLSLLMRVGMAQNLQNLPWSFHTRVQGSGVNWIFALLDYLISSWLCNTCCQIPLL